MSGLLLELVDKLCGAIVSLPLALIYVFLWDRQRAKRRWGWMTLLVLYLSAMYIVIGVPGIQYITWEPTINWVPFRDFTPSNLRGMALNAVMFAPLGFLLPAYFEGFRRWNTTLAAGFATSLAIECIQLFTFRATDINDLMTNTTGAILGGCLGRLVLKLCPAIRPGWKTQEVFVVFGVTFAVMFLVQPFLAELVWKIVTI